MDLLFLIVIFAVFLLPTFFMARKQRQAQAQVLQMQAALSVGDAVITASGLHGVIVGLDETVVDLDIADDVVVTVERASIARVNPVPVDNADIVEPAAEPVAGNAEGVDYSEERPTSAEDRVLGDTTDEDRR
ncbi:preprotein translocase subunit YajC [Corynebacterium uterequi]|uniref:Preprotein translocase, YajC subunit n=1 Tax=Corynebacterium uterequi TaxID=1072256 RepID=A0A0G3HCZ8_9CORY|nr:preprotein translocase subunit YajC [Corynebacterium uterequi]AKK11236.1 preprotein translocase, YajC subunit [Corynebacterium uterequi]